MHGMWQSATDYTGTTGLNKGLDSMFRCPGSLSPSLTQVFSALKYPIQGVKQKVRLPHSIATGGAIVSTAVTAQNGSKASGRGPLHDANFTVLPPHCYVTELLRGIHRRMGSVGTKAYSVLSSNCVRILRRS